MTTTEQLQPDASPLHVITMERRSDETDTFYARRLEDPLVVAFGDDNDRQRVARLASQGLHESINEHRVESAIEFATDFAYRAFGRGDMSYVTKATNFVGTSIERELKTNEGLSPLKRLKLQSRELDVMNLQVFGQYQHRKDERSVEDNRKALTLLESVTKDVIIRGAKLLKSAQKAHEEITDQRIQRDMRGLMFEQLFTTYQRLKVYAEERYDEAVVVGATFFEDASATHFKPKNHNYDVLIINSDGATEEVVQCKNAHDETQYETPIRKINGHSFSRFMHDPGQFISAISRLANNSAGVSERQLHEDQALLDSLFEETTLVPQHLGELATIQG